MSLIEFDFSSLLCSSNNRQSLRKIYKDVQSPKTTGAAERRLRLANLLTANSYDAKRGLYVPLSNDVRLDGKFPRPLIKVPPLTAPLETHFYTYFTNPLVVPEGHDLQGFDIHQAPDTIDRLTNAGWIVATIEFDWESIEEFNRNLDWFSGKDGHFYLAPFADVDKELRRHHDYRGFCAVYGGRVSVHMHFVYDTTHLANAPYDADYRTRVDHRPEIASIMKRTHRIVWGHVVECVMRTLAPSREPDLKLRSPVQWRRAPFGVNTLQRDCDFLGLKRGWRVPQIVLQEVIREEKRAKGSVEHLIDPDLTPEASLPSRSRGAKKGGVQSTQVPPEALDFARKVCADEWGVPYPCLRKIDFDGEDAIINFKNHDADENPSSFVKGNYRKIEICGRGGPTGDFYLPGDMTANEFVSWIVDIIAEHVPDANAAPSLTPDERKAIIARARDAIRRSSELYLMRERRDRLIMAVEGVGKSRSLLLGMHDQILDKALESKDHAQHFMAYAGRSRQQANDKRREYENLTGGKTVLLESLSTVYERMCEAERTSPLSAFDFESGSVGERLATIKKRQPKVFERLERYRQDFWKNADYASGTTMVFTSKATIRTWHSSFTTRAWLHPAFEPDISPERERAFARDFGLGIVAFDELELDEFLHVWDQERYDFIKERQEANPKWTSMPRHEKLDVYRGARGKYQSFEEFDADMRVRLSSLEKVAVDFDFAPFGGDKTESGIYRRTNGTPFFLGVQEWVFSSVGNRTFLTTERLMAEVVRGVYRKCPILEEGRRKTRLMCKYVEPPPELFPITIEVFVETRANAKGVAELASEITGANPNGFAICNGVKGNDRVLTFQRAKGANDLADRDIYVVVTHLHPDHYAELNVIGQWLGISDVVELYYRDQISQAVGRNRGFRDTGNNRKTVVITSMKLGRSKIFEAPVEPPVEEPTEEESELRALMRRRSNLLAADNEFSPRRSWHERLAFRRIKNRPW